MDRLFARAACLLVAAALVLAPLSTSYADDYEGAEIEPFLVMSMASFDEVIDDLTWIAQTAGFDEEREMAEEMVRNFVAGVSLDTPMGVVAFPDDGDFDDPIILGFVPVDDIEPLLDMIEDETGERPEADENGVYDIANPNDPTASGFAKLVYGFLYFTNGEIEVLDSLPAEPLDLLGDLPDEYLAAARFNLHSIPEDVRQEIYDEMREGFAEGYEEGIDTDAGGFEFSPEFQREMLQQQTAAFMDVVESSESVTFGLGVDERRGSIFLDCTVKAAEDSPLAETFAGMAEVTTEHSGFLLPEAAMSLNFSGELSEGTIRVLRQLFVEARMAAEEELEDSDEFEDEDERERAQMYLAEFFDVLDATIAEGKLDGGAAVVLEDETMTLVCGGRVADGISVQEMFEEALENDPERDDILGERFEHNGVQFQTIYVPAEDEDERELFGEKAPVVFGFSDDAIYLGVGENCEDVFRAVLDGSAEAGPVEMPPFQFNLALTPMLRFVAAQEGDPLLEQVVDALESQGAKDRIILNSTVEDETITFRLEVEEGVIVAVGETIRQFQQAFGGPGGAVPIGPAFPPAQPIGPKPQF